MFAWRGRGKTLNWACIAPLVSAPPRWQAAATHDLQCQYLPRGQSVAPLRTQFDMVGNTRTTSTPMSVVRDETLSKNHLGNNLVKLTPDKGRGRSSRPLASMERVGKIEMSLYCWTRSQQKHFSHCHWSLVDVWPLGQNTHTTIKKGAAPGTRRSRPTRNHSNPGPPGFLIGPTVTETSNKPMVFPRAYFLACDCNESNTSFDRLTWSQERPGTTSQHQENTKKEQENNAPDKTIWV